MEEERSTPPVACTLDPDDLDRRTDRARENLATYRETTVRGDELTLTFDGVAESLPAVAAFVEAERGCCAFAEYRIEVSPPYEETRLVISGPEGTVDLFREGFVAVLEGRAE